MQEGVSLYLCVGAALALALSTNKHVSLSAAYFRELVLPDGLFS